MNLTTISDPVVETLATKNSQIEDGLTLTITLHYFNNSRNQSLSHALWFLFLLCGWEPEDFCDTVTWNLEN